MAFTKLRHLACAAMLALTCLAAASAGQENIQQDQTMCDWDLYVQSKNGTRPWHGNEAHPTFFRGHHSAKGVVVCRAPKAGSLLIRSYTVAHAEGKPFKILENKAVATATDKVVSIDRLSRDEALEMLQSAEYTRVLFSRHPVDRIVSGYTYVMRYTGRKKDMGPRHFANWVVNELEPVYRGGTCTVDAQRYALKAAEQHFLPGQHCRCAIPCGVKWWVLRLEDHNVHEVLRSLVPDLPLPEDFSKLSAVRGQSHRSAENEVRALVNPAMLAYLNELTKVEQEVLGYRPFQL